MIRVDLVDNPIAPHSESISHFASMEFPDAVGEGICRKSLNGVDDTGDNLAVKALELAKRGGFHSIR